MLEGSAAIFGVMFVSWMEFGFYFVPNNNPVSWRFPIAFQAFFPLIVMGGTWFLPESPRWLQIKDRHAEAKWVLARLEAESEESELVAARMQVIQNSIILEQQGHTSNPFARTPNRYLNRTLLAIGVNILAQMSGINVITFYSNKIFQDYLGKLKTLGSVSLIWTHPGQICRGPVSPTMPLNFEIDVDLFDLSQVTVPFWLASSAAASRPGNS